jgi:hypothetical protein
MGSMGPTADDSQTPPAPLTLQQLEEGAKAGAHSGAGARALHARLVRAGRPEPKPASTPWRLTWQWVVAAAATLVLAWLTYSRAGWIPILSAFDLGVHEFGHLLTLWAPRLLCSFAGSLLQVAAPLILGGYFLWRRDSLAAILMVAWAAENLHNVSVYVADAQAMILPLFGDDGSGAGHDWHNILGALGWLEATDQIALLAKTGSVILFVVALGLAALGFVRARRA